MSNSCIRVYADQAQIKRCKAQLTNVDSSLDQLATALGAAGNNVRFRILYLLFQEQKMCPCDISDVLEMTVPAVSQHLKKLRSASLVTSKRVGQTNFYALDQLGKELLLPILQAIIPKNVNV